ncbi:hypothetical protein JOU96_004515 [Salmonella enterica]|nr:hypothetical protein [Salmonella enterica]EDL7724754.1 hypothetical protein [Salmonella enterica subsp. enterica serovar Give]EHD9191581.1 hypothetical protein [Salmonella enterica]EJW5648944.1 hypothetical protein [Salmonella enterica]ELS4104323.1 hypothetical protein [Salmonella enterica]
MNKKLTPSADLLTQVRAGLIENNTNLHKWCSENGVLYANARQALIGTWNGPKGTALREQLVKAAGLWW